jgi:hypothetical protein
MRWFLAVVASLLVLATGARAAVAQPGMVEPAVAPPAPITKTQRYGGIVLLADAAWIAAATLSDQVGDDTGDENLTSMIVLGGYYGGGPLVHLAYGNPSGARKSLAARALLPLGGALLGMLAFSGENDSGALIPAEVVGMMLGGMVGVGTAMIIDWTVIAKRRRVVNPPPAAAPVGFGEHALRPAVKINPGGVTLSLAGSF